MKIPIRLRILLRKKALNSKRDTLLSLQNGMRDSLAIEEFAFTTNPLHYPLPLERSLSDHYLPTRHQFTVTHSTAKHPTVTTAMKEGDLTEYPLPCFARPRPLRAPLRPLLLQKNQPPLSPPAISMVLLKLKFCNLSIASVRTPGST